MQFRSHDVNHCQKWAEYGFNPKHKPKYKSKIDKVWLSPTDFDGLPGMDEDGVELLNIGFEAWR